VNITVVRLGYVGAVAVALGEVDHYYYYYAVICLVKHVLLIDNKSYKQ